jgi:hypothetical protein
MWALAEHVERIQRQEWRKKFGTEYDGFHEGKPVRFAWHERVVGHVCFGDIERYGHLRCQKLTVLDWVWLRSKPQEASK